LEQARATLELPVNFASSELKRAYRDMLLVWHPDRFIDNSPLASKATSKTQEINKAYALLKTALAEAESGRLPSAGEVNQTSETEAYRTSHATPPTPSGGLNWRRGQKRDARASAERSKNRALARNGLISCLIFGLLSVAFGNFNNPVSIMFYINFVFVINCTMSFILAVVGLYNTLFEKN